MNFLRFIVIVLLIVIGINALTGGLLLMLDPSGATLHLNIRQLSPPIFRSFLIPGMLLFVFGGIMSTVTAFFVIFRWRSYPGILIGYGAMLLIWIGVQMYLFGRGFFPQYLVAAMAAAIILIGFRLRYVQPNS